MRERGTVALLFRRLGPYHYARLRAAARRGRVVAIEASDADTTYGWAPHTAPRDMVVRTVLNGVAPESAGRRRLERGVWRLLTQETPDVVAVPGWSDPLAIAALRWCRARGVPAVVMSDSARDDAPRAAAREWVKRQIVRLFSAGLVGGARHREYAVELGLPADAVWDGYDVVDNEYFSSHAMAARSTAAEERARLGVVGPYWFACCRFIAKKNLRMLLDAYARYRRQVGGASWRLVLAGDGPLKAQLENQIAALGLGGHVTLPGFVQYDLLPAYYGLASAFVHASTTEQWGLVVNEAMASGLPVLVSRRCGCVSDLVAEGENGYTFDPTDVPRLAALMAKVHRMGSERARLGARGLGIISQWGPDRFGESLWAAVRAAREKPLPPRGPLERILLPGVLYA